MTTKNEPNGLSDFLLQVTQAKTFRQLQIAYTRVTKDFDEIINRDEKGRTTAFVQRYRILDDIAKEILKRDPNGIMPSEQDVAIIGEMVILRDVCLKRLEIAK
ncbi:MAG: hypothetical protein FK730_00690 [Asgard group archaeon]|nr:hypothetical protein [Asgard group archaeon]